MGQEAIQDGVDGQEWRGEDNAGKIGVMISKGMDGSRSD